jgi:hypothetical protein
MDADRRQRVARATEDLLEAIRELARVKKDKRFQQTLLAKAAPERFLKAIDAFAEAIGT